MSREKRTRVAPLVGPQPDVGAIPRHARSGRQAQVLRVAAAAPAAHVERIAVPRARDAPPGHLAGASRGPSACGHTAS